MPTHFTIWSPIMTDAVWCTPTCGINYSVSHHDECRLVHPDMWYQYDGCRLVHPNMWYQLNVIRHQDGCRLVHLAKWDISSMSYAIMTDVDWCIPPKWDIGKFLGAFGRMPICASHQAVHLIYQSIHIYDGFRLMNPVLSSFTLIRFSNITFQFHIHIYDGFRLMNPVLIIIHIHSVFKYQISIPYSLSYYLFKDILNLCTYFIYSFTYSFHILIHVYSFTYSFMCSFYISFIYSFTYNHSYIHSYTHSHTHSYTHSCILIHILIHVLILYTHSYTHSRILIHIYSFIYSFTYSFIYSCMYTHSHTHSCAYFIYSFIYSFMYTHSYTHLLSLSGYVG